MTTIEEKYINSIKLLERTFVLLQKYVDANQTIEKEFTQLKNELIRLKLLGMRTTSEAIERSKDKFKRLIQFEEPLEKLRDWRKNQNDEPIKSERIDDPSLERYIYIYFTKICYFVYN